MKGVQWMDIRSDRQKGLSYTELGKKYHMDPRTAKRYAEPPKNYKISSAFSYNFKSALTISQYAVPPRPTAKKLWLKHRTANRTEKGSIAGNVAAVDPLCSCMVLSASDITPSF